MNCSNHTREHCSLFQKDLPCTLIKMNGIRSLVTERCTVRDSVKNLKSNFKY